MTDNRHSYGAKSRLRILRLWIFVIDQEFRVGLRYPVPHRNLLRLGAVFCKATPCGGREVHISQKLWYLFTTTHGAHQRRRR